MTIYNKTKTPKKYGNGRNILELPPSLTNGQRGPAVVVDFAKHLAIGISGEQFLADQQSGAIEIAA